jgi:hypothetical protein
MNAPLLARELTVALGGRWHGCYGTARCPAHQDRNPSLSIGEKDGRLLIRCHTGCPQAVVIDALRARGLWTQHESHQRRLKQNPPAPQASLTVYWNLRDAPRATQRACGIWRYSCGPFSVDSPAGRYLIGRGIPPPWPETLAYGRLDHPETRERGVPALIVARHCAVVHMVRGIQRIFLTEHGQKYPRGTVKMSLGSITGGRAELLWPDDRLLLCEGVESALSAWRIFKTPAWAICGGFPPELPLPQRVRSVKIVADHDVKGVSERHAKALARAILATGRSCTVVMPNDLGADANDVLRLGAA